MEIIKLNKIEIDWFDEGSRQIRVDLCVMGKEYKDVILQDSCEGQSIYIDDSSGERTNDFLFTIATEDDRITDIAKSLGFTDEEDVNARADHFLNEHSQVKEIVLDEVNMEFQLSLKGKK